MATNDDGPVAAVAANLIDDDRTLFRDLLAGELQELIEAELTAQIGAAAPNGPTRVRISATGTGRAPSLRRPVMSTCDPQDPHGVVHGACGDRGVRRRDEGAPARPSCRCAQGHV